MSRRETSKAAYDEIKATGVLAKREWEVYDLLYRRGPLTANEVFQAINQEQNRPDKSFLHYSKARFTELRNKGALVEMPEKRVCSVSKKTVLAYDVTKKMPADFVPKKRVKCVLCGSVK